ncbi:MAG TPA: DNA-formamidopyrimidine glycosylase [Patescibacteria group bacterium]|nr:DNA-formamidopyrimidine glycosylase [Patescibacteria group bacterium]
MPELPEVETIRRTLADRIGGRTIQNVDLSLARLVKWPVPAQFLAVIMGKTFDRLERRGKYLLFYLKDIQEPEQETTMILVVHLRMTGRLRYLAPGEEIDRFTHVTFHLDNGDRLIYADTRTLGTLYLVSDTELWRLSGLAGLGPEPLSAEFTLEYFQGALRGRKGKIKGLLLNQQIIGGMGNIYADECLAVAGLSPERSAGSLTPEESRLLYDAVNQVIREGIEHGGTTFRDYRDGDGKSGSHQRHLAVYGRANQPCSRCGGTIIRKEIAGRGAHFCPECQK